MINAEEMYSKLFSDERIIALVPEDNIFNGYPDTSENFPCIGYIDENQNDSELNDNKPSASDCFVEVHIFSKKLDGYTSAADIAKVIGEVMSEKLWYCSQNRGNLPDPDPNTEHRVLRFQKSIYNN